MANQTDVPRYSLAERDRRWAIAQDLMRAEGVDALLVFGEHECAPLAPFAPDVYFTNDRPGSIVMFFAGEEEPTQLAWSPMSIEDNIEARKRGDALWIAPASIRVGKDPAHVAQLLTEHGLHRGTVGVIGLEPYPPWHIVPVLPHALYAPLTEQFPQATFKPVWFSLLRRIIRNSEEELALVRHVAAIGDAMAQAMLEASRPGVSEAEVFTAGMAEGLRRGAHTPHMLISSGPGFVSWGPAPWSYRPQPPRVIKDGDVIMAEVFNSIALKEASTRWRPRSAKFTPISRRPPRSPARATTSVFHCSGPGTPSARWPMRWSAPSKTRPGGTCTRWCTASTPTARYAASAGDCAPTARRRTMGELGEVPTIGGELPLAPGMTFSLEPSCVLNGRMVNIGGTVIVGEDNPLELNPLTAQLLRA
jgi:Xaa-Pro aminopeptidase